jgi:hypothetical protein
MNRLARPFREVTLIAIASSKGSRSSGLTYATAQVRGKKDTLLAGFGRGLSFGGPGVARGRLTTCQTTSPRSGTLGLRDLERSQPGASAAYGVSGVRRAEEPLRSNGLLT